MKKTFIESSFSKEDQVFDTTLRPSKLKEFSGQKLIKQRLEILIGAAKKRQETLSHCLFYGPPGLGKTTLAAILAEEMGTKLVTTSGPAIEKPGDLAGIMTSLEEGDILFIDEIHRLSRNIEEYLYPAMEDFKLDLLLDSGPNSRSVQVKLNSFTLVGATTRIGLLSSPLRSRFPFSSRLDFYDYETLQKILMRSAAILKISMSEEDCLEIAKRSRGTPRIANNLLKWVRDYSQIHHQTKMSPKLVKEALEMLCIDEKGLDEMDKKILTTIIDHHDGGPVGIKTIAAAIGEEDSTISEVYEPYLLMLGLIKISKRGREATKLAYKHLNKCHSEHN